MARHHGKLHVAPGHRLPVVHVGAAHRRSLHLDEDLPWLRFNQREFAELERCPELDMHRRAGCTERRHVLVTSKESRVILGSLRP
jgi:hypothetical protein